MEILSGLLNGVTSRPYVFVFLALHLALCICHLGLHRALLFTVLGYVVALVCEASSIHNGFPFGLYYYRPEAFHGELTVAGVPYWDSLSFAYLTYFSYTIALFLYSPHYRIPGDFQLLETKDLRRAPRVLVTAALFMAMIDAIIDPVTLQGGKWFLGPIYFYPDGGVHFGVPISNYLGWFFVGLTILVLYTVVDILYLPKATGGEKGCRRIPYGGLWGGLVYLGVVGFILAVTLYVGDYQLATASSLVYVLPLAMAVALLWRREKPTPAQVAQYLDDFPDSALARSDLADGPYAIQNRQKPS